MGNSKSKNIRLGIFVLIGTILLIASLYFIGRKQNLFGKTFSVTARFQNVGGLMEGNNVRFLGIDVGTVESVEVINDSTVEVVMIIDESIQPFIKKNAMASVGTDGLMGNKIVNIISTSPSSKSIEDGDELKTQKPINLTDAMTSLSNTNKNLEIITNNLSSFTQSMQDDQSLWALLSDSSVAEDIRMAVINFKRTSEQSKLIAGDLKKISADIHDGKGTVGTLINDTSLSTNLNNTMKQLENFSDSLKNISMEVSTMINELKSGKGSAGQLLSDTMLMHNLNQSLIKIQNGAESFDENMEAMKSSWPFKKYYRKKGKK
jgi:phospholipid/cholesterol/gamma-HCH transport system substrate-binding protein